jgi:hypothetical protein
LEDLDGSVAAARRQSPPMPIQLNIVHHVAVRRLYRRQRARARARAAPRASSIG